MIRAILNHDSLCKDEPEAIRAILNHDSLCKDEPEAIRARLVVHVCCMKYDALTPAGRLAKPAGTKR